MIKICDGNVTSILGKSRGDDSAETDRTSGDEGDRLVKSKILLNFPLVAGIAPRTLSILKFCVTVINIVNKRETEPVQEQ